MRFIEIAICAGLISFMAGMFCETQCSHQNREPQSTSWTITPPKHITTDKDIPALPLKSCSKVNIMPCEMSPPNPLKESLDAKEEVSGRFKEGENVTCIYPGVFYHEACSKDQCTIGDDSEFIKNVAVECKVVRASEVYNGSEQQIKVDCSKDLETKWSATPGPTMVKGHKLNFTKRWFFSDDCYHFVQSH